MAQEPKYLGDGVLAKDDGYQIWVQLDGQNGTEIALEPQTMSSLMKYAAECYGPDWFARTCRSIDRSIP